MIETDDQYIYKRSVFEPNIARAANPSQTNGIIQSENSGKGGATYIYRSRPNFEECNFISNKATAGMGGIFASGGAVDMTLSAVPENMNNNLRTNLKSVAFSSCNFRGNFVGSRHEQDVPKYLIAQSVVSSRTGRGGAVSAVASEVSFYNCTLENNMAGATNQSSMPAFAGAIFLDEVSRGMLNSSSLRDNIVVNGFGADIVIIDVDFPGVQNYKKSSPYADGIAAPQKLLIQNSSFITSASSHLHHPVDSIILHDQIASILCLGGGVIIGEGNDFQQTTIVAAGKGSVLGQAIIGIDIELRDAYLKINPLSETNELSVLVWNATVEFQESESQRIQVQPSLQNMAIVGGKVISSQGLSINGDLAVLEGSIQMSSSENTKSLNIKGRFYSGLSEDMIRLRNLVRIIQ